MLRVNANDASEARRSSASFYRLILGFYLLFYCCGLLFCFGEPLFERIELANDFIQSLFGLGALRHFRRCGSATGTQPSPLGPIEKSGETIGSTAP